MNNFDSFLSYASEDTTFATELVGALKSRGFKIWYAPIDLNVGEKLLDSIEEGMTKSNSGILLISQEYLKKGWTNYEMDTLIRLSIEESKKIFPVWHNVKKADVEKRHVGLGGIIALDTNIAMPELVSKLTKALASFAPTIGVVPGYESPSHRFLQGRGEITIGQDGPATTLWEFLIHAKDAKYPMFLDGNLYSKEELLLEAAQLLPHVPDIVRNWVGEEGRQQLWGMCLNAGIDPANFE